MKTILYYFGCCILFLTLAAASLKRENIKDSHAQSSVLSLQKGAEISDTTQFEILKRKGLPPYQEVVRVFRASKLDKICNRLNIDQMEKDLMFLKAGLYPFEEYKNVELKDGTERKLIAVFPEERLRDFYEKAREVLKQAKQ